jgi:hypothetical protein
VDIDSRSYGLIAAPSFNNFKRRLFPFFMMIQSRFIYWDQPHVVPPYSVAKDANAADIQLYVILLSDSRGSVAETGSQAFYFSVPDLTRSADIKLNE